MEELGSYGETTLTSSQSLLLQGDSETAVIQSKKSKGASQKLHHQVRGRGLPKISEKKWRWGEGGMTSQPKNVMYKFLFLD